MRGPFAPSMRCIYDSSTMTIKNALVAILAMFIQAAAAADWKPSSQVEIVVPNAPGGGNDAVGPADAEDMAGAAARAHPGGRGEQSRAAAAT